MEAQKEEPIPAQMEAPLPSMCVDWEGTRWSAGTGERIHPLSQGIFKTGVGVLPLAFLVWIGLLFNPTDKQLQGKRRSDRHPNRFNGAYFRGCKLVFACAIKWLASAQGVAGLVNLAFAWILLATSILEVVTAGNCDSCPNGCR